MAAPRLAVIGQGYVGLPLACALADKGNKVVGVDVDAKKVRAINSGRSPMAGKEPGLDELLLKVVNSQSLVAVTDIVKARGSKAFFVCVDTPVGKDKKADLTILKTVSVQLGKVLGKGCL
ncbi:MAG: UDP-glucose 6-dehydrogenase, partial [Methanomassiliicoccales archaeon]|nr:UDP-glucose 6-dehydrogenase [Methanomassiliicoccales archaeon]